MAAPTARFALALGLLLLRPGAAGARRVVILVAPPSSGKGTQAPNIQEALHIPHLSTGEMLRDAVRDRTPWGLQAQAAMNAGAFVNDAIVNGIVRDRLLEPDCDDGVLLDGYPRSTRQAELLDGMLADRGERVTDVIHIRMPLEAEQDCLTSRWVSASGSSYNSDCLHGVRPRSLPLGAKPVCDPDDLAHCNMRDDVTGEPLYRRSDDNLHVLATRLKEYREETEPLLAHYAGVVRAVDGNKPEPQVWAEIRKALHVRPELKKQEPKEEVAQARRHGLSVAHPWLLVDAQPPEQPALFRIWAMVALALAALVVGVAALALSRPRSDCPTAGTAPLLACDDAGQA